MSTMTPTDDERRAAAAARQRRARQGGRTRLNMLATQRANTRALRWVRQTHPKVWRRMLAEAVAELELEQPDLAIDRRSA